MRGKDYGPAQESLDFAASIDEKLLQKQRDEKRGRDGDIAIEKTKFTLGCRYLQRGIATFALM